MPLLPQCATSNNRALIKLADFVESATGSPGPIRIFVLTFRSVLLSPPPPPRPSPHSCSNLDFHAQLSRPDLPRPIAHQPDPLGHLPRAPPRAPLRPDVPPRPLHLHRPEITPDRQPEAARMGRARRDARGDGEVETRRRARVEGEGGVPRLSEDQGPMSPTGLTVDP